ncbi:nitrogen fixation protein NifB [Sporobacter termitidis DSM 10068]|uniref:FeMo cofactor biosynthesis protein NifB n=1 Tax=Sporobacter termitidis DSM 10068 TaxID=1123282 RepID=A0A1M5TU72_9FIRM|nr:radical SAM protein [Sporobacter termitidis]SHH54322.1 nitrogen fixation protein NifB [Sporobacter termitidis DSM 10068]
MAEELRIKQLEKISGQHPCFSGKSNMNKGRVHLPVSPTCNIQCKFCKRSLNKTEQRPGVTNQILTPEKALEILEKALELCPDITVAGIAGPGDTLATPYALETFRLIKERHPELINCLSTNGLLLERYADELWEAGVKTITVTVNAVDPYIQAQICSFIFLGDRVYEGVEAAQLLIDAQKRGIRKMAALGAVVKINIVLIPGVNDDHIADIAETVSQLGASIINIIPLIPQHEMADFEEPGCQELSEARAVAEEYLPVFRHCQHCRADAVGIPGKGDLSHLLYEFGGQEQTFSHG